MFTPWNEIQPEKHLFQSIPVVPLFQNSPNLRYSIPLGFHISNIRVFKSSTNTVLVELFLVLYNAL